jgi:formylglycine-generating enzyme required for sulfatase activity
MNATYSNYLEWLQESPDGVTVELGPWFVTGPLKIPSFDDNAINIDAIDTDAKSANGESIWHTGNYTDGTVHSLPGGGGACATYLYRTITVGGDTSLTAGFGSDDGMELWLNGERLLSKNVPRGPGADQDVLELPLKKGVNHLLFKVHNQTGNHGFYFALKENPLLSLWNQIAADFPREAGWFARDIPGGNIAGWFSAQGPAANGPGLVTAALGGNEDLGKAILVEEGELAHRTPPASVREWLDLHLRACHFREGMNSLSGLDLKSVRRAVEHMAATFPDSYDGDRYLALLDRFESVLPELGRAIAAGDADAVNDIPKMISTLRGALLANPLLDFDRILAVRRANSQLGYPQNWQGNCSMAKAGYDNELVYLEGFKEQQPRLTTLYKPDGSRYIGDVDLFWDADRLLFSSPGSHDRWQIWEIRPDGSGLRQMTSKEFTDIDNYDACYLPDGRIIFASTGCFQGIPCVGGADQVANLFLMNPDGSGLRQLCFDQDHNWCPTVLNNGRVMYTRWEYSDTPHYFTRVLFHMNPDGTNQMEYYGSNSFWPNSMFYARPVPGSNTKFAAIVSGHHGVQRMGELVMFDAGKGRFEADGVVQRIPGYGEKVEPIIVDQLVNDSWPKFLNPYPLSDEYLLVSCKPDPSHEWGIYLVDVFDNMTLLMDLPGQMLLEPVPLKKTPKPPVIPDKVDLAQRDATVYLSDIYKGPGLKGVPAGSVKKLRVYEFHYSYNRMGGHIEIGVEGPWDVHRILGTVPVYEDGSAYFRVPANTPIAVQPLDDEGKAIQLMRSWFTAMPGEVLSCVGCHEPQNTTAPIHRTVASRKPASEIEEWFGPARGFSFKREVQPVLDRHCIRCHDGEKESHGQKLLDFTAKDQNGWGNFTQSYLALHPYVRRPGPESDYHVFKPTEYSADTSELIQMLKKGHHGVQLEEESWERLYTWIDLNVPDHGTWAESAAIPGDFHERRCEMRAEYAGRPEDPEFIPETTPFAGAGDPTWVKNRPERPAAPALPNWPLTAEEALALQKSGVDVVEREFELAEGVYLKMVRIPAGEYVMGGGAGPADQYPANVVRVDKPFWMAATEITNAQFQAFDPRHFNGYIDQNSKDHTTPGYPIDGPTFPAVRLTWEQANEYCDWLTEKTGLKFSLPTEAQWEWACRAGSGTAMNYGDLDADFSEHGNMADLATNRLAVSGVNPQPINNPNEFQAFLPKDPRSDDGERIMTTVARYKPNVWGLYDMHGNAAEWTRSAYRSYPFVAEDGRNDYTNGEPKVVRGGSWRDRPKVATSAYRLAYEPWRAVYSVGLRVVCEEDSSLKGNALALER